MEKNRNHRNRHQFPETEPIFILKRNSNSRLFRNILNQSENEVVVAWLPSHQGIAGNDLADKAAKAALDKEPEIIYTAPDAINIIKNAKKQETLRLWLATEFNFLRKLKDDTKRLQSEIAKQSLQE